MRVQINNPNRPVGFGGAIDVSGLFNTALQGLITGGIGIGTQFATHELIGAPNQSSGTVVVTAPATQGTSGQQDAAILQQVAQSNAATQQMLAQQQAAQQKKSSGLATGLAVGGAAIAAVLALKD